MFFGESAPPPDSQLGSKTKPGQLNKLYYTSEINEDHIKLGFRIPDYSAQTLVDAGVLKNNFGKFDSEDNPTNTFDLTEVELLAAASWESWITWLTGELLAIPLDKLDDNSSNNGRSFGFYCLKSANIDLIQMRIDGFKMFQSLKDGDTHGFYSASQKNTSNAPNTAGWQKRIEYYITSIIDRFDCKFLRRAEDVEKLVLCYEWLKNIHDTYYGRQFLVRIGDSVPKSEGTANYPLDTICIKDEDGDYPNFEYPYFVDSDGSAQGYFLSDIIDNSGGFPDKYDDNIIGLENLDWIQTENGKVGSFVRIGPYSKPVEATAPCSGLFEQIKYPKFSRSRGETEDDCENYIIDISKLNPDSFSIGATAESEAFPSIQYLYMSCSVSELLYVDENGTWAHITLADKVPMILKGYSSAQGFVMMDLLLNAVANFKTDISQIYLSLLNQPFNVAGVGILQYFFKLTGYNTNYHGARPDSNILNIAGTNSFCLIPEAAAIPFKSNLYKYGPFYYGDANAGGVDVVFDEDIAPWNFIQAGQDSLPAGYAYTEMENIGKATASSSPRDLQKLEKGRITVAGLPCYCLGHWVDNKECYDEANELGPTLLTDINVEFGSGGYNTTYNFATYTPRFGKPEKYLTEAWKTSIKDTQYLNKYLKSLEKQVDQTNQSYKLRLINGERGGNTLFPGQNLYFGPNILRKSTPNSVMFSGYYFDPSPTPSLDMDDYKEQEEYNTIPTSYPEMSECGKYICTTPTPITWDPAEFTTPSRLYSFAETDKAYTTEYMQNTYHQLSGMSLDGFYLPVSLRGVNKDARVKEYNKYPDNHESTPNQFEISGDKLIPNADWTNSARLPRFAKRCEHNGEFVEWDALSDDYPDGLNRDISNGNGQPISSKTRDEIPPFKLNHIDGENGLEDKYCYSLQINQRYLNPMLSVKNLIGDADDKIQGWDDRINNSDKGFVISSIIFGQDHIDYQITHTNPEDASDDIESKDTDEFIRQQFKNFRFPALRGPLVLQGWGYDTSGKPIPNKADGWGHAQQGEFRKENLTDKFMQNWLQNPKTWPVGPIDLRFDRERGVWTCPSPNKIVVARLKEKLIPNGSAKAELINPEAGANTGQPIRFYENYSISGPNGENVKLHMENTEITVYDFLGIDLCQCDIVYAYYDDNRYIVLESDRAYKDPNDICTEIVCTTTTTTTTTPTTTTTVPTETTETPTETTPPPPPCDWCGLECLQSLPGYKTDGTLILGAKDGCLQWFETTECGAT
jgi:hypothetical protein